MKKSDLRDRSESDLAQLEGELARDLWKSRFSNFTNQLDDTAKIGRLRREIARVKTIRTQKQAQGADSAPKDATQAQQEAKS